MNLEQALDRPIYGRVASPIYADVVALANLAVSREMPNDLVEMLGENTQRIVRGINNLPVRFRSAMQEMNLLALHNSILMDRAHTRAELEFVGKVLTTNLGCVGGLLVLNDWDMSKVEIGEE